MVYNTSVWNSALSALPDLSRDQFFELSLNVRKYLWTSSAQSLAVWLKVVRNADDAWLRTVVLQLSFFGVIEHQECWWFLVASFLDFCSWRNWYMPIGICESLCEILAYGRLGLKEAIPKERKPAAVNLNV